MDPSLKKPNVQTITSLFSEEVHQGIIDYVTSKVKYLPTQDDETFVRSGIHNPAFFVHIHNQLSELASDIFGTKVEPSYCYLSMYKDTGTCPLHIDRRTCRYTIDYLINQDDPEPWPICISAEMTDIEQEHFANPELGHPTDQNVIQEIIKSNIWETVLMRPNDAVCYSGTHSWHYRPNRLKGNANLVFFHFVPEDFIGSRT